MNIDAERVVVHPSVSQKYASVPGNAPSKVGVRDCDSMTYYQACASIEKEPFSVCINLQKYTMISEVLGC